MPSKKSVKASRESYDYANIGLVKWASITWTLFLIGVWPWLRNLVLSIPWYVWLVLAILFSIKPIMKYFSR